MMKILVTGGPVYAHLDAIKIISNNFRGGRMAGLVNDLTGSNNSNNVKVTYLTAKGSIIPNGVNTKVMYHKGFYDYMEIIRGLAPKHDAVILGAAVCNLIPMKPWTNKFPSHKYKVGDRIPIDFTIAPRVIDQVKKVAPNTHLFGFKLLKDVPHNELIDAAYDILLESKATAVFANDASNLDVRYAVTKECGEIIFDKKRSKNGIVEFILNCISDKYYSTCLCPSSFKTYDYQIGKTIFDKLVKTHRSKFVKAYGLEKYKFGTIAVRLGSNNSFITTGRGKKELNETVIVHRVDHRKRLVNSSSRATLNAPLIHKLFKNDKSIRAIVHYHEMSDKLELNNYAPAGTVRDASLANKPLLYKKSQSFQIEGHGIYKVFKEKDLI